MTQILKGKGRIAIPNVNSVNECIQLNYTLTGLKDINHVKAIRTRLDNEHKTPSVVSISITKFEAEGEAITMNYKVMACGSDKKARTIKETLDQLIKKLGGQTSLDDQ